MLNLWTIMVSDSEARGSVKEALPAHRKEFDVDGGTLAPSCVEELNCSTTWDTPLEKQLQFLISKADDLQRHIFNRQDRVQREAYAGAVTTFLYTCQPYFTYLESTARRLGPQRQSALLHTSVRSRLFNFSQRLCTRLLQLVQSYAEYDFLSLDETKPDSVPYFCIGQCQVDRVRWTIFYYCQPQPYLARTNTGLYKCIRWNVERDNQPYQADGEMAEKETVINTEYYFLCYEDTPEEQTATRENEGQRVAMGNMVRTWSIGQWAQTYPDPETEDLYDWITCGVPQAQYRRLLCLGREEPSICSATDYLLGALLT